MNFLGYFLGGSHTPKLRVSNNAQQTFQTGSRLSPVQSICLTPKGPGLTPKTTITQASSLVALVTQASTGLKNQTGTQVPLGPSY